MDASSKGGSASCNVIKSAEDEDYLSNLCSDPDNDKVQRHVDHVNVESCQTPSKIPKQTDNFESSLEEHVFNQNMLSTSSPKPSPRAYLGEKTSSISSFKDKEPNNEDEHSMNNAQETLENQSKEAEEIVKKLCKNGKIMQFHEGDDYIKVIVYEDSQESNDLEDTLSVEELENTAEGNDGKDTEPRQTKNLLQCLTENSATNRLDGLCGTPLQPFPVSGHTSIGQPLKFTISSHQPFLAKYSVTSSGDLLQTNNLLNTCNTGTIPFALTSNQQYNQNSRNGFMFYRPSESQDMKFSVPGINSHSSQNSGAVAGQVATSASQLQLNSSGEEYTSPTDLKPTLASGRGKAQPKVRSLMQTSAYPGDDWGKIREQHNQKERRRRARIKEACNLLRQLVPGMSDKTDKATVFEFAARYVHFLKSHTGTQFDKDFLMKYSPY